MHLYVRLGTRVYELEAPGGRIGSAPGLAVSVQDATVLPEHAELFWREGRWWVRRLSSKMVYIDGYPLDAPQGPLGAKGALQVGNAMFDFWEEGSGPTRPEGTNGAPLPQVRGQKLQPMTLAQVKGDQVPTMIGTRPAKKPDPLSTLVSPIGEKEGEATMPPIRVLPVSANDAKTLPGRLSDVAASPVAARGGAPQGTDQATQIMRNGFADWRPAPPPTPEVDATVVSGRPGMPEAATLITRGLPPPSPIDDKQTFVSREPLPESPRAPAAPPPPPGAALPRPEVMTSQDAPRTTAPRNWALWIQVGALVGALSLVCLMAFLMGMHAAPTGG